MFLCFIVLSLNFVAATNETVSADEDVLSLIDDDLEMSVDDVVNDELTPNLTVDSPKTIEITQDNYDNYFNERTGKIWDSVDISEGDVLKIGNITERAFVIDRQLTLMPITSNDQITNGFVHLIKGSDGSTITNLTINNTKTTLTIKGVTVGQLHGIWLSNSNNNLIAYNTIRIANSGGVYALPMGWSSNNRIIYNDMKTYISTNIIMGSSHYNLISHNSLEVLSYSDLSVTNLIYFNPFGHADYYGSPLCKGNIISYNYLKGFCTLPMSIILQFEYANHEGTVVANNTIIKGSFGVNLNGNNVSVYGNTVINSAVGISVSGADVVIYNNDVSGDSQKCGIQASGTSNSKIGVFNNNVTFTDVSYAMNAIGNANVHNNIVNVNGYGVGISVRENSSDVSNNNIKTNHDSGISVLGNYNDINNNIVNTHNIGVNIPADSTGSRYYNNTIANNKITSESYGISVDGLVYNTVITDNVIETNATPGINIQITDQQSNTQLDNMINGVILNSTAIVVNDDNYYQYFNEGGYLTVDFPENKTKVIILTFLTNKNLHFTDKINVISNNMNNLLYNVTVTFEGDSEGSLISDFNFVNQDKMAIVINGVNDVSITRNNITGIFKKDSSVDSVIFVQDVCEDGVISYNNIYVNSKLDYVYAINAPSYNPSTGRMNKKLSGGFDVANNAIIMISTGMAEAIYTDTLANSNFVGNKINIISDGYGYGIAFASIIDKLSGLNISSNEIIIYSKQMAYLVEGYNIYNSTIENNELYGESQGVYGVAIYRSDNISIKDNDIQVFGGDLNKIKSVEDTLGLGNSAIALIKDTNNSCVVNNLVYVNGTDPIVKVNITDDCELNVSSNLYVVEDGNINTYFNKRNKLISGILEDDAVLLFGNITNRKTMEISSPIIITSYKNIPTSVALTLTKVSNSIIHDVPFVNSSVILKDSSNVLIINNSFDSQYSNVLTITGGNYNYLENNSFIINSTEISGIVITKSQYNSIKNNLFDINGSIVKIITNDASNYDLIENNIMNANADNLIFIFSKNSRYDNITKNTLKGNASSIFGYYASKVNYGTVTSNIIEINGFGIVTNQSGIYYDNVSNKNEISENSIVSTSINADDYAVVIMDDKNLLNSVTKNYLISSNSLKMADDAVYAPFDHVYRNTPIDVYVSKEGDDVNGDGSEYRPYASISKAVEEALNHVVIYVDDGQYNESNINVGKNLSIVAINPGKVIIDAQSNQLFNISDGGIFSIANVIIQNAHNELGGSVFINNGKLFIYNSIICNSSSYYDNSNPIFDRDIEYGQDNQVSKAHTFDCSDSGNGGVILNNGELLIDSSLFYGNLGHIGGVIADYGKLTINSSAFYNNEGVHGGVIYSDSENQITIENSLFKNNTAITSLDFCALRMVASVWSISDGYSYSYYSECINPLGSGGVVYTKNTSLKIDNSSFISNSAKSGGVIATQIDSFSSTSTFESDVSLEVNDCYFNNNRANDTRKSLGSNDLNNYRYNSGFDGGVVYGTFNKLYLNNSSFYQNQATNDGGVLHTKANDGQILDCVFEENTAGTSGGALDISSNFIIMRSIISNNSARYGGAIQYASNTYYGHIQNNLNIYDTTISNNLAINRGGAFNVGSGNITVHNSNIVNNKAPAANTIYASSSIYAIDMRNNYWGDERGPDDSVWNVNRLDFRPWSRQWIKWEPEVIESDPTEPIDVNPDDDDKPHDKPDSGNGNSGVHNPISTGSSTSTGTSIGGNGNADGSAYNGNGQGAGGNGNAKYSGSGDGVNLGPGGGTGSYNSLPGFNDYSGQSSFRSSNSSSNVNSQVDGTVNSNSMSKTNSSNYHEELASIGMVSNAAAVSSSSGGESDGAGESSAASSSGESSVSKSYELNEKIDEILDDDKSMLSFVALAIVVLTLLVIGYKRKERENEE